MGLGAFRMGKVEVTLNMTETVRIAVRNSRGLIVGGIL